MNGLRPIGAFVCRPASALHGRCTAGDHQNAIPQQARPGVFIEEGYMLRNRVASLHRLLASLGALAAISAAACSGGAAGSANPASPGAGVPAVGSSGAGGGTPDGSGSSGATSLPGTGSLAVGPTPTPFGG